MNTIDATQLADMTIQLLERTAMVLAEPARDAAQQLAPTRFASIAYSGPSDGAVYLCATDGFLREVAASLLGVDATEVDVERDGLDALKEMTNTVGGSVILALAGDRCTYSLGLPQLVAAADVPASAARAACTVVADGGMLRVLWGDGAASKTR